MLPIEIELAVEIGVTGPKDLPVRSCRSHCRNRIADRIGAVQQPECDLPGRRVLPYEIGVPIVIEISNGSHSPQWIRHGRGIQENSTAELLAIEHPHTQL